MTTLLIIFAKEPVAGQVKTRLCPPLTPAEAAGLCHSCLQDILAEMGRLSGLALALAYAPPEAAPFFRRLAPAPVRLFPQEGADLGERMARAFTQGFSLGFETVLLMGSDLPDLPGAIVSEAQRVLARRQAEVVLGPSRDGGYYLVGLRSPHPEIFPGVAWSTADVLPETLQRLRSLALPVHLLPAWSDLDTYADLLDYLQRPHPAPRPGWRTHSQARSLLAGRKTHDLSASAG